MARAQRYEIIESKVYLRDDGRTFSIHGACPWNNEVDKQRYTLEVRGYTVRDKQTNTVGIGRVPWKTREEAQAWIDEE